MGDGGDDGSRALALERTAQGTLEYALVTAAVLAVVAGLAAVWHAGRGGALAGLVERAASHALEGLGPLDIALF